MPPPIVYSFTKTPSGIIYPFLPIIVVHPSNPAMQWSEMALLDTGADHCVFPQRIPNEMKYDLKSGRFQSSKGIADGKVDTWWHLFKIHLLSQDRQKVVWKSKEFEVGCFEHDTTPPLLGYTNFLCNFKVTFNYPTKKILLELP